jgi:hypothetical protein
MHDDEDLTRQIVEVEAESVAYFLCTLLDLPGQAESRFYIRSWMQGDALPEKSAKRIFGAADRIMKAGQPSQVVSQRPIQPQAALQVQRSPCAKPVLEQCP